MPDITDNEQTLQTFKGSHFGFSAVRLDDLGATEYTLATVVVDHSYSTDGFQKPMEEAVKSIVQACQKSPRADNLLLRVVKFSTRQQEIHGFLALNDIKTAGYDGELKPDGSTCLYDATIDAVDAVATYGKQLLDQDYAANAIVFVITDGEENTSTVKNPAEVKNAIRRAMQKESVESLQTVLIGVSSGASAYLQAFKDEVGFDQFVDVGDASPQKLAKLAAFVSQSISSTSQALGSGGPSQPATF